MIPGLDPRQMKAMMRQLGMSQTDLEATQVIIKTPSTQIIFDQPQVQKIIMQGQTTFQITGEYREEEEKIEINISEEDVELVCEQTGVDRAQAKETLEKTKGDIAQAIVELKE